MPLQQTAGNNTYDAYGGGAAYVPAYIEDVFSAWLFNGTGASNAIVNNVDLLGKGGLVWEKQRNAVGSNLLYDTNSGAGYLLSSNGTSPSQYADTTLTSFNSTGFTLGSNAAANGSGTTYVSWTFRKQLKFFDIVSFNGASSPQNIAHNLGSVPGCIFVKNTSNSSSGSDWCVYHQSLGATKSIFLNTSAASSTSSNYWNNTAPTSSVFTVGTGLNTNNSGETYIAYLFASDAGGFGLTGNDNVITCGSTLGSSTVNLGYEPQWVLVKSATSVQNWYIFDNMRGLTATVPGSTETGAYLWANSTNAEAAFTNGLCSISSTGFSLDISSSETYIYIAIRRGPMKVPTVGTSVFSPVVRNGTGAAATLTTTLSPVDMVWAKWRSYSPSNVSVWDRLRGKGISNYTPQTYAEENVANTITGFDVQNGYAVGSDTTYALINATGNDYVNYNFKRAPRLFDEVCYTGTGATNLGFSFAHNLTVTPELSIIKARNGNTGWAVWSAVGYPGGGDASRWSLNDSAAATQTGYSSYYTSTLVYPYRTLDELGNPPNVNGTLYVAYLFASCPGVSKVGTYTGTGATQTIDCGFTGGARFVLIKRTDASGAWFVWDTARGMVAGTDPSFALNSTGAESNTNSVYTTGVGFQIVSTASGINASGGTYLFLAIA
jgi:hypothetical protein